MEFLFAVCTLAIVIGGLLIMTQVVGFERLGKSVVRILFGVAIVFIAFWTMKTILLPILICALVWLNQAILAITVVLLIVLAIALLLRTAFVRFAKQGSARTSHKETQS
jgi:hypothetical protein